MCALDREAGGERVAVAGWGISRAVNDGEPDGGAWDVARAALAGEGAPLWVVEVLTRGGVCPAAHRMGEDGIVVMGLPRVFKAAEDLQPGDEMLRVPGEVLTVTGPNSYRDGHLITHTDRGEFWGPAGELVQVVAEGPGGA